MLVDVISPTKGYLRDLTPQDLDHLRKDLAYRNTSAAYMASKHAKNHWLKKQNEVRWKARLEELQKEIYRTLLLEDEGGYFIRPGYIPYLQSTICDLQIKNNIKYPALKKIPWKTPLPFTLHDYQDLSYKALLEILHGNVELCTSAGKSAIILTLCREGGLNTAIVAPSLSIFNELVKAFEKHLGKGLVGKFGDGKKILGKRFTVCIADSLANVEPGTKEWEFFSKLDMLIADESHLWGAKSLDTVCHGVLGNVPYRFFLSGTQTRNDGSEKLLRSIIGKTVHTLTTAEAVKKGYISPHDFRIVETKSSDPNYASKDPLAMKRVHYLNNRNIAQFIANVVNAEALVNGRQSLVLVEELSQIELLLPLLKVPYAYAHSEKKKERLAELGMEKVETGESVDKFNRNEVKVLIGTDCVSTGTNIYPTHNTFNWQGGSSEIKTKQGTVGRSVRWGHYNPYASKCVPKERALIWDFMVRDVPIMIEHLKERISFYKDSDREIKLVRL